MPADLAGKHILITSGPTRANLDAVRFISNRSSGRLGRKMALEALGRGAQVTFVAGPDSVVPAPEDLIEEDRARLRVLHVETVPELVTTLEAELAHSIPPEAVLHAMAVLDYVPGKTKTNKTPSGRQGWDIRLVRTPKVIQLIRKWAPQTCLVEFKLEVGRSEDRLREIALASLRGNRADLVVANDLKNIRDEAHPAFIIAPDGQVLARPATKGEIARRLCDILAAAFRSA